MKATNHQLLTVADAEALTPQEVVEKYSKNINPGLLKFFRMLGFDEFLITKAEGMYYYDNNDRKILDFMGGFGSLAPGHNHPRILAARQKFQVEKRQEIALSFLSQYAAALSHNLAAISPGDLCYVHLCTSGSETIEVALKTAEQVQGPKRSKTLYTTNSFHGKTRGALSVTDSGYLRANFKLVDKNQSVAFGDIKQLEEAFKNDPSIGIFIIEPIQGGAGIIIPPDGYLTAVRALCDRYNVIWIADEVQSGVGRTGHFYSFQYEDVVPDIVTIAKSLGGGKTAIGATIVRQQLYMKAFGSPTDSTINSPATFSGMGEACCTAIEMLNLLYDERLIDNAASMGAYLLHELSILKEKYPKYIKDVRGRGLMVGIEFHDFSETLPPVIKMMAKGFDHRLKGGICGFVGSLLLKNHGILIAFTQYNKNVIRLEPPLIVEKHHIDHFIKSFDQLLSMSIHEMIINYIKATKIKSKNYER